MSEMPVYKKKDFVSDQEIRWCPGCGDYSIVAAIQMVLPKIGKRREDIAFISGIGCSSRFPYYMNTYGVHSIHGRAPAIASGVKLANPDLSVWVITGDGDGLSIGGNHFMHAIRRNLDINIILFNNEIYGLTKGQYSPTSKTGTVTKSSPYGSIDRPLKVATLSIASGASFFARTVDTDVKHMQETFIRAAQHKGVSVVEVLQNCVIFNDKVHEAVTDRKTRDENALFLAQGKPMIFGAEKNKGIMLKGLTPTVVTIGEDGVTEQDLMVHDETTKDTTLSFFLGHFELPKLPVPLGVFRDVDASIYNEEMMKQLEKVSQEKGKGKMEELLNSGDTWVIK